MIVCLCISKEIGRISECDIEVTCPKEDVDLIMPLKEHLPQIFMVASVSVSAGEALGVSARKTGNIKCERCWRFMPDVGSDVSHPSLCRRCADAVKSI